MKQELVNAVYDKLDEVRDAFDTYIDKADPTDDALKASAGWLDMASTSIRSGGLK